MMRKFFICTLIGLLLAQTAMGKEPKLDVWRSIPVFETKRNSGRLEPLESFARQAMDDVCEQPKGTFKVALNDYLNKDESLEKSEYAPAAALFPKGEKRSFVPEELLLSWMAEPEKWEVVPFIHATHKDLRELLEVPEKNDRGLQLKYVSPRQIFHSQKFRDYVRKFNQREEKPGARTPLDQLVFQLIERYQRYRAITLDPRAPLTAGLVSPPGGRREFLGQISQILEVMQKANADGQNLENLLEPLVKPPQEAGQPELKSPLVTAARNMVKAQAAVIAAGQNLYGQHNSDVEGGTEVGEYSTDLALADTAVAIHDLERASKELYTLLRDQRDELIKNASPDQQQTLGPLFRELADKMRDLHVRAFEANVALYEDGNCLRVVPALNPEAVSKKRDSRVKSQPWYSLATVLTSEELMVDYPQSQVKAVKAAWRDLKTAYVNREDAQRVERCAAAERELYDALQAIGEGIETKRADMVKKSLEADARDADMLVYTRWPDEKGRDRLKAELTYVDVDPFAKSWQVCLFALACFALSFGVMRKPMFIGGIVLMFAAIACSAYGFALRVYITQWAPVTNMYETVVWVAFMVMIFGTWFVLLPLIWPGLRDGLRLSAFPFSFEAKSLDKWQLMKMGPQGWLIGNFIFGALRLGLMVYVFKFLAMDSYADGNRPIFTLALPITNGSFGGLTMNDVLLWVARLVCLVLSVWFLPRIVLTLAASAVLIPWDMALRRGPELAKLGKEVRARWPIAVGATVMSALGAWITSMAPSVLDESFSPLQPVLRSNFWLTVHVLAIVSSYAAGMLALGIGMIALGYYIFGRYRDPVAVKAGGGYAPATADGEEDYPSFSRRPPEQVAALAQYAYRAVQVAVLLLAIGTILGGIWADASWGRFWGWDPKEVWALVSLLVYLAILHGRFAGWFNNFGMICGTVLGAMMIIMSWYGVNFVLPMLAPDGKVGLHSYGAGAGGLEQVLSFVGAMAIFQIAGCVAYLRETSQAVQPMLASTKIQTPEQIARAGRPRYLWATPLGMWLGIGALVLFASISTAYVLFWVYWKEYSWANALSLTLPIPALGVLLYVIFISVLSSLGVKVTEASTEVPSPGKAYPAS